jgi:hypothetical protein
MLPSHEFPTARHPSDPPDTCVSGPHAADAGHQGNTPADLRSNANLPLELVGFCTSSDSYTLEIDVRLPDGSVVPLPASCLYAAPSISQPRFEQWAAWYGVELRAPSAARNFLKSKIPFLRTTRVERAFRYSEAEDAPSRTLREIWLKATQGEQKTA